MRRRKKNNEIWKVSAALILFAIIAVTLMSIKDSYVAENDNIITYLLTTPDEPIDPMVLKVQALTDEKQAVTDEIDKLAEELEQIKHIDGTKQETIESLQLYIDRLKKGEVSLNVNHSLSHKIDEAISKSSVKHGVDKALIRAVIKQESNFNLTVVSTAGAQGLMQLMPDTARWLGVANVWDIEQNIDGGTRFLKDQLNTFGDMRLALAAYNAGPNAVKKFGGVPPYRETQDYVVKVIHYYNSFK
jgi:membrane-bound lytic murein transglycosylase B